MHAKVWFELSLVSIDPMNVSSGLRVTNGWAADLHLR